jgi:hypothetical protein
MNLLNGFHKHHIIPKCFGGSDDENNLVLLHPVDHMIQHFVNYKMYGRWQDAAAAKLLGYKSNFDFSEKEIELRSKTKLGKNNPMFGKKHSDKAKKKMSENMSGAKHRLAQAIKYKNIVYPTHRSLAKFLNISQAAVSMRIKTNPQKWGYEVVK